jgi:hypothetical protein
VWRGNNGALRVVERLSNGERHYYFAPRAEHPYLVTDLAHAYAYDQGALVGVYDNGGGALPEPLAKQHVNQASRYFARGSALYGAAIHGKRRAPFVIDWRVRQLSIRQQLQIWRAGVLLQPAWKAWHDSHANAEQQQWQQEHAQRLAYAASIGESEKAPAPATMPKAVIAPAATAATPHLPMPTPVGPPPEPTLVDRPAEQPQELRRTTPKKHVRRPRVSGAAVKPSTAPQTHALQNPAATTSPHKKKALVGKVGDFFKRTFGNRQHDHR